MKFRRHKLINLVQLDCEINFFLNKGYLIQLNGKKKKTRSIIKIAQFSPKTLLKPNLMKDIRGTITNSIKLKLSYQF